MLVPGIQNRLHLLHVDVPEVMIPVFIKDVENIQSGQRIEKQLPQEMEIFQGLAQVQIFRSLV